MLGQTSQLLLEFTSGASSCSGGKTSAALQTSREKPSAYRTSARRRTCSYRQWQPMSVLPLTSTSTGSRARPSRQEIFADGKIDAFLGFPPEPQDLRARNIG